MSLSLSLSLSLSVCLSVFDRNTCERGLVEPLRLFILFNLIKLFSVATDLLGKSGRAMLEALIEEERDRVILAELALGRTRSKRATLREALTGHFDNHHAELCRVLLAEIDAASEKIDLRTARFSELVAKIAEAQAPADRATGAVVLPHRDRGSTRPRDR